MSTLQSEPTLGFDRRRSARRPHIAGAWICSPTAVNPELDRIEVTSLNLSRHGVAFELPCTLPEGAFFTIEIGVGDQRLCSEVKIVSIRRIEKGHFAIGAEFS